MADTISGASARRIGLAAQGFGTRHPDAVGTRQLNLLIQRLGLLQIDGWKMLESVKHGDTIRLHSRVIKKKEVSKPTQGVVSFQRQCIKQDGTVAQEMTATLMYRRRPKT